MSDANRKEALAAYIERVVDEAPPLSREQRDKLAVILQPKTLVDLPAPTEGDARRIMALLDPQAIDKVISEPLQIEVKS